MNQIISLQKIIQQELEQLSCEIHKQPKELYEPIVYTLQFGGKRIRPVMLLLACDMFGGNIQQALPAAIAIELFHNFTLVHDDIMDNATLRRGNATVHTQWNNNIAILSGDALLVKAYQKLAECKPILLPTVLNIFNKLAIEVCEGQQLDMNYEQTNTVTIAEYINMITLKTAVLLAGSLKIGALLANATEEEAHYLYEFGKNIGIAFQLQDDLLDVYGDEKKFGKQVGGDIISNKKTYLLLKAMELSNHTQKAALKKWLQLDTFDNQAKITAITTVYNALDIPKLTQELIENYCKNGLLALSKINLTANKKAILHTFVQQLMTRQM